MSAGIYIQLDAKVSMHAVIIMGICGFLHSEKVSTVAQTMCTLLLCLLLLLLQSLQQL